MRPGRGLRNQLWLSVALVTWTCGKTHDGSSSNSAPVSGGITQQQESLSVSGTFAYADSSGKELLAFGPQSDPSLIRGAICRDGKLYHVRYERTQKGEASTHRQIAMNFRNEEGDVFRVLGGIAPPDETCFLSADQLVLQSATGVQSMELSVCDSAQSATLAIVAHRETVNCWRIAEGGGRLEVLAAQFRTVDSSALAGLALMVDSVVLFHEIDGVYRGPHEDIWRVEDQGVFAPDALRILFVARLPVGYTMSFVWPGAEGEDDELVLADSGARSTRTVINSYRYWAPN